MQAGSPRSRFIRTGEGALSGLDEITRPDAPSDYRQTFLNKVVRQEYSDKKYATLRFELGMTEHNTRLFRRTELSRQGCIEHMHVASDECICESNLIGSCGGRRFDKQAINIVDLGC